MNEELIKTLYEERNKLYPYGCPIRPRGCGKTLTYMYYFLAYISYDVVCNKYRCKCINRKISLEEAHRDMRDYIKEVWRRVEER